MDFSLSSQQSTLQDSVRRFCREHYDLPSRQRYMRSPEGFSPDHWARFAELGWLGAALPEEAGGFGGSVIEGAIILEEFGRVLVVEPYLACAVLAANAVWFAARPERRRELLEPMISGERRLVLAHTEGTRGDHAKALATTARGLSNGAFVLRGRKTFVLGGSQAHQFLVTARIGESSAEAAEYSLFLVDGAASGLTRRHYRTLDGSGVADLTLQDVEVPAQGLLSAEEKCRAAIEQAIDCAIVGVCAEAVGAMDRVISTTADYLKTRRAYGTTLSTYQALQHRLADMLMEFELSRSILYHALSAFSGDDVLARRRAASTAKALIGRAGKFIGANGIQLHGGMGMVDDYIIGQQFKRLTVIEALFGSSDIHLQRRFQQ